MTGAELRAALPLMAPATTGILVMLAGAMRASRQTLHALTLAGMAMSLVAVGAAGSVAPLAVAGLLSVDGYALFYLVVLYVAVGVVAVVAQPYFVSRDREPEAFYSLLLFSATGMGVLACSSHFAALFLGLEILTISLYALIGYLKGSPTSLEAAFKYLVLAAVSSAFLLFGIALLYSASGSLELGAAAEAVVAASAQLARQPAATWALVGALMLLVGFGFKLALVPFHMWSPDVYQGSPAPVTALIATGSKGAMLAVLLRLLAPAAGEAGVLSTTLGVIAVATMFAGNLLALLQDDIKRLLAYSSVAHLGYALVAVVAGGSRGAEALTFYVLSYVLMSLGAFGVIIALSYDEPRDVDSLQMYRGLGHRRPFMAATLTVMLLSLAGIPPTAGFFAKFAVLSAALEAGRWGLALALAVASGLAVFYYLRVVVVLFIEESPAIRASAAAFADRPSEPSWTGTAALALLVVLVVGIGLYPGPWLRAVGAAIEAILPA